MLAQEELQQLKILNDLRTKKQIKTLSFLFLKKYVFSFKKKKKKTYYLAVPRPTLGHFQGDSLANPMLITAFIYVRLEGHREPRNEVGSLSPA